MKLRVSEYILYCSHTLHELTGQSYHSRLITFLLDRVATPDFFFTSFSHTGLLPPHPSFCSSRRDRALCDDDRVLANMLALEPHYSATMDASYGRGSPQDEIRCGEMGVVVRKDILLQS